MSLRAEALRKAPSHCHCEEFCDEAIPDSSFRIAPFRMTSTRHCEPKL